MLITDQYQYTDCQIRYFCNLMMNIKLDELMTRIGMVFKLSESLMNPKEEKVLSRSFDSG